MGRSRWLGAWLAVGLGVVVGVAPALADTPAKLGPVTIQGDAVVGATLTAVVGAGSDPVPTVDYEWARAAMRNSRIAVRQSPAQMPPATWLPMRT
jgi:hypothetical protein